MIKIKALLFCFAFNLLFCSNSKNEIDKIVIRFVPFEMLTDAHVSCNNFERDFNSVYKTKTILNPKIVNEFEKYFKNLKYSKQQLSPDTRAKIFVFRKNGRRDTLCLSNSLIELNGHPMVFNKQFVQFIIRLENDRSIK